jgi:hypothetical protein
VVDQSCDVCQQLCPFVITHEKINMLAVWHRAPSANILAIRVCDKHNLTWPRTAVHCDGDDPGHRRGSANEARPKVGRRLSGLGRADCEAN